MSFIHNLSCFYLLIAIGICDFVLKFPNFDKSFQVKMIVVFKIENILVYDLLIFLNNENAFYHY